MALLAVAVVIFLLTLIATTNSFQHCVQDRKTHQAYKTLHEESSPFVKAVVRFGLNAACARVTAGQNDGSIAALATIVVAFFTYTLWRATDRLWQAHDDTLKETTRIAEEEFVANHPPQIAIRHVWLLGEIWKDEHVIVEVVIVNEGKTVAILEHCELFILVYSAGRDLPISKDMPVERIKFWANPNMVGPGIEYTFENMKTPHIITDMENAALRDATSRLYCIGEIRYQDRHGRSRKTAFCRLLDMPHRTTARSYRDVGRFKRHSDPDYDYQA